MHYYCFLWKSNIFSTIKSYARDVLQQKCWHLFDASSFTISIWIWSGFCWIWIDFFLHHNHFSVFSCRCCCSAACVCFVKPSTICHRCEHESFDYYCDYFVWCVLGTKIQMESHIIDLTHRCVNSRCNVTHFKWYVCVFFLFFCYAYHSIVFVELCWMLNNIYMFSLRHLVWLIGGSNKILKPEQKKSPIKWNMSPACCFSFSVILKRDDFQEREQKRAEIDFFYSPFVLRATIVKLIHLNNEYMKKNANTRMTSNMCQNTHCRRLLGVFVKPLKI